MEKYYTPELQEFHIGFEFQRLLMDLSGHHNEFTGTASWKDCVVHDLSQLYLHNDIRNNLRVKYLDKEDIESFGFIQSENCKWRYINKDNIVLEYEDLTLTVHTELYNWESCIFAGTIKNKSELKKLLKQLGIHV